MRAPKDTLYNSLSEEEYGWGNNSIINFYQEYISPVGGKRLCPMYPSCSQYAKLAFNKYPPYVAFYKTCERLLRCGQELSYYETIKIGDNVSWYDPIKP